MPQRESPRASKSLTAASNPKSFSSIEELPNFARNVNNYVNSLPEEPKGFNRLVS